MPRPEVKLVTFSLDGREVTAPENAMLVDGAKYGDMNIPVFCYEPKLGAPVGACRMCLVEIEGIPKLQTACSTPVKDGMVVHTQTDRVHEAQRAIVEFLLINHPLDCPVCDKGGECPLQDITYGWGPGTTRFIEPKRHFRKPLELSPLIAIDRERCIMCYRCVRFSQEIAEDYQLVIQERGANSYISTFDGRPYVAPFSGNITELCPVGALTSSTYRFRARPWDIEGSGSVCTLCPAQCNVELTVRDDRVMRVLARDHDGVDDGWLCDKGRYAFQYTHVDERITQPLVRGSGGLQPSSWEQALHAAAGALELAAGKIAAVAGGETTNEEAFLAQRLLRDQLGSNHLCASPAAELPARLARALAAPRLQATVADLEFADTILILDCDPVDEATIWDLRIRKGVRRNHVKLAIASARPTALDPNAAVTLRHAPGQLEGLLVSLDAALTGDEGNLSGASTAAGTKAAEVRALASLLSGGGGEVVIVASERSLTPAAAAALLNMASRLGLSGRDGAGLLLAPTSGNGRGLREAGFASGMGPGYAPVDQAGLGGMVVAELAATVSVLYLLHADVLRTHPDRDAWAEALRTVPTVIAHESVMTDTVREYADVVFPAEAYPEKEGTVVHPDGRLQRLRPAIGRPGAVRAGWWVIAELSARAGASDERFAAASEVSDALFAAVPHFRGLTLDAIGGRGLRWQETDAAAAFDPPAWEPVRLSVPDAAPGGLRLGTFRTLWASKEVDMSPILRFARPAPLIELSAVDAARLGIAHGEEVEVACPVRPGEAGHGPARPGNGDGHRLRGPAVVRAAVPPGSVFVPEGIRAAPANLLTGTVVEVRGLHTRVEVPSVLGVTAAQGIEGRSQQPTESDAVGGIGGDAPLAPQEGSGDQTADAPSASDEDSDPDTATGGAA